MVAACPAARKPSTRLPGISATISITGGMYLCAERTEKFCGGPRRISAAVATAVVSKPVAKNTTSSSVSPGQLHRLGDAVDHVHLRPGGPGIRQRAGRAGDPEHVPVGGHPDSLARQGHAFVDLGHVGDAHRAAGAHDDVQAGGKAARRPNRAMACSWLPQTCITETGVRPISRVTFSMATGRAPAPVRDRGT